MGNTCKPMAVSFQCMTKFTTNKKKLKKKKKVSCYFYLGQNEEGSPGDSSPYSSEKPLQGGRREGQYVILGKREDMQSST